MTWHYIFAEYSTRSNNINDLRPAERPLLLKISLGLWTIAIGFNSASVY